MSELSFPKKERLCGEIRIGKLFSEGNAFIVYPLRIVYLVLEEKTDSPVKILISIPKKKIKLAVDRNRIKRLIKEAYRLNKADFLTKIENKGYHLSLAITYLSDKKEDTVFIEEKVKTALSKILRAFNEKKET